MAYDLKATLTFEDKMSSSINKSISQLEKFEKQVKEATDALERLDNAQNKINSVSSGLSNANKNVANQTKAMTGSMKDAGDTAKVSTREYLATMKALQGLQAESALAAKSQNKINEENAKHSNEMEKRWASMAKEYMKYEAIRQFASSQADNEIRVNRAKSAAEMVRLEEKLHADVLRYNEKANAEKAISNARANDAILADNTRTANRLKASEAATTQHAIRQAQSLDYVRQSLAIRDEDRKRRQAESDAKRAEAERNRNLRNSFSNAGKSVSNAWGTIGNHAGNMMRSGMQWGMYGGAAVGYVGYQQAQKSLDIAMTYEQALADIKSNMSKKQLADVNSSGVPKDLALLDKEIRKVAVSSTYTTEELANTALAIVRAGSEVGNIISTNGNSGELQAAVDLALATNSDPIFSGESIAMMKSAFKSDNLTNDQVANIIAGVDNASITSAQEIMMGMRQLGLPGEMSGLSMKDSATWIGMLANMGLPGGSDAGTSIKTMLGNFANPTGPSYDVMKDNLKWIDASGKKLFHDAKGQLLPLDQLSKMVYETTKNMDAGKRTEYFYQVGGDDGIRALSSLYMMGANPEQYNQFIANRDESTAKDRAGIKMETASAQWQGLKNSMSIASIEFFGSILGPMRHAFDGWKMQLFDNQSYFRAAGENFKNNVMNYVKDLTDPKQTKIVKAFKNGDFGFVITEFLRFNLEKVTSFLSSDAGKPFVDAMINFFVEIIKMIMQAVVKAAPVIIEALGEAFGGGLMDIFKNGFDWDNVSKTIVGGMGLGGITAGGASIFTTLLSALGITGGTGVGISLWNKYFGDGKNGGTKGGGGGSGTKTVTKTPPKKPTTPKTVVKTPTTTPKPPTPPKAVTTPRVSGIAGKLGKILGPLSILDGIQFSTSRNSEAYKKKIEEAGHRNAENISAWIDSAFGIVPKETSKERTFNTTPLFDAFMLKISDLLETTNKDTSSGADKLLTNVRNGIAGAMRVIFSGGQGIYSSVMSRDQKVMQAALNSAISTINGTPIPQVQTGGLFSTISNKINTFVKGINGTPSSRAGGEHRVGSDGIRYVHKDEAILTRGQANAYRSGGTSSPTIIISGNNFGSVRSDDDIDAIAKALAREIFDAGGLMG